jgi:hypothetical protein
MYIECVIVSVDYGDFLAETLPVNLPVFDHLVVVTTPRDVETQAVCRKYGVDCYTTNLFDKSAGSQPAGFAKARGINHGLAYIQGKDWIVHMDADIALQPLARQWLDWAALDPACLYGIDRFNCPSFAAWRAYRAQAPGLLHPYPLGYIHVPPPFSMGARITIRDQEGYLPPGFFQLWHGHRRYPVWQGDAEHTDISFAMQWDRQHRRLLPELYCVHLDSMPSGSPMGANWKGRKSPRFGPKRDPDPGHAVCY